MEDAISLGMHGLVVAHPWLALLVVLVADYGVFVLPVIVAGLWLLPSESQPRRRKAIVSGGLAACVALCLGLVLERTLNRPRPFIALGFAPLIPHVSDSSFPSDHTLVGVALIGALAVRVPWIGPVLLGWALLVGVARIAAGLHYASDIVGSAVLALVLAEAAWLLTGRLLRRLPASVRRLVPLV